MTLQRISIAPVALFTLPRRVGLRDLAHEQPFFSSLQRELRSCRIVPLFHYAANTQQDGGSWPLGPARPWHSLRLVPICLLG